MASVICGLIGQDENQLVNPCVRIEYGTAYTVALRSGIDLLQVWCPTQSTEKYVHNITLLM